MNIYELFWEERYGTEPDSFFHLAVCPHCQDEATYYPEGGAIRCDCCRRYTWERITDEGEIRFYQSEIEWAYSWNCPICGWHVVDREDGEWHCLRCRAWFKGDLETGPVGEPQYQPECPTCREPALLVTNRNEYGSPTEYRCDNCKFVFDSDARGNPLPTQTCQVCGRPTVQNFTHVKRKIGGVGSEEIGPRRRRVYREVEEIIYKIKRCCWCGQLHDEDLIPIDVDLKPIPLKQPEEKAPEEVPATLEFKIDMGQKFL